MSWPTGADAYRTLIEHHGIRGDQSSSLMLPTGDVLWLYGDFMPEGGGLTHGVMALQRGANVTLVNPHEHLVPMPNSLEQYWVAHAVVLDLQHIGVFVAHMRQVGETGWDFAIEGMDLAHLKLDRDGVPHFTHLTATPASHCGHNGVTYGNGVLRRNRYTYVYGTRTDPDPWLWGKAVYVARVPNGYLEFGDQWRYWDGAHWIANRDAAVEVVPAGATGWSTGISVHNNPVGGVVAVTKLQDFLGTEVIMAHAPQPQGPWTSETVLTLPPYDPADFTYQPMAHPWAELDSGKLLITVSHNGDIMANPNVFRPSFHEVS